MTVSKLPAQSLSLRAATPEDAPVLFALILALAEYEKLVHQVQGNAAALAEHLGGDRLHPDQRQRPIIEAILAEVDGQPVGFALFFTNYSTFLTKPGIYLEDLFVLPEFRGQGIGKALIRQVAGLAAERGCGRFEWSVLDWNESAIAFYQRIGATVLPDWRICRMTGAELQALAAAAPKVSAS